MRSSPPVTRRALLGALAALGAIAMGAAPLRAQRAGPAPANRSADPRALRDLPVFEVRAAHAPGALLAVLLTGDGGWMGVDKTIGRVLAEHGIGVVAIDSRAYLSKNRTPETMAADVARVARAYLARWGSRDLLLVGYSRGADVMPFVVTRLPADVRERTRLVAMLGLATTASFQFHWTDLVREARRPTDLPVLPELAKLRGTPMLCVYGTDETDSACRAADSTLVTKYARPGAHHFDHDYRALGDLVAAAVGQ